MAYYDTVIVFVWRDWINLRKSLFVSLIPSFDFKFWITGIWMRGLRSCSTSKLSNCSYIILTCLSFLQFNVWNVVQRNANINSKFIQISFYPIVEISLRKSFGWRCLFLQDHVSIFTLSCTTSGVLTFTQCHSGVLTLSQPQSALFLKSLPSKTVFLQHVKKICAFPSFTLSSQLSFSRPILSHKLQQKKLCVTIKTSLTSGTWSATSFGK
jgi:hypothetical protein